MRKKRTELLRKCNKPHSLKLKCRSRKEFLAQLFQLLRRRQSLKRSKSCWETETCRPNKVVLYTTNVTGTDRTKTTKHELKLMNILGLNIEILILIGLCDTDNKMLSFRWMKTLSCVWLVTIQLITYHFTVLLTRYRAHQWTQTGSVLWLQTDSHISSSSWWFFLSAQFFVTRKLFSFPPGFFYLKRC